MKTALFVMALLILAGYFLVRIPDPVITYQPGPIPPPTINVPRPQAQSQGETMAQFQKEASANDPLATPKDSNHHTADELIKNVDSQGL